MEVLAASQSTTSQAWFQGTADAVRQYLWLFDDAVRNGVEDLVILSGKQEKRELFSTPGPIRGIDFRHQHGNEIQAPKDS